MDVRCERCRAQYVFDDDQVTPAGLTVQCTNCGHVFKVRKKELVVTVPVKPGELAGPPVPASAAAPRGLSPATTPAPSTAGRILTPVPARPASPAAPAAGDAREWRVRQANGNVFTFRELTTLQKWIIEQKVSRDDEISQGGENWKRLGNIPDLASFFQVVEAAERAKVQASVPAMTPVPMPYPMAFPPQGMFTPPPGSYGTSPYATPVQPATPVSPEHAPARRRLDEEFDPGEPQRPRRRGGAGRTAFLLFLLLLVSAGAAVYLVRPEWLAALGLGPARSEYAVPITVAVPAAQEKPAAAAEGPPSPAPGEMPPGTGGETPAAPAGETGGGGAVTAEPAASGAPAGSGAAGPSGGQAPVPTPEPVEAAPPKFPEPVAKPAPEPSPPKGPKALLAEATRLRLRGSVERALDLYGQVVSAQPENAEALAGRGLCYLDLSRYEPAEASFQAALRVDPEEADALLGLAETYRWQGRRDDAIKYFERYLAFHPDGDEAAVARNAIAKLRE